MQKTHEFWEPKDTQTQAVQATQSLFLSTNIKMHRSALCFRWEFSYLKVENACTACSSYKPGSLENHVVLKISSVEGNLFDFGLICYFCPGSPKNQHFGCPIKANFLQADRNFCPFFRVCFCKKSRRFQITNLSFRKLLLSHSSDKKGVIQT